MTLSDDIAAAGEIASPDRPADAACAAVRPGPKERIGGEVSIRGLGRRYGDVDAVSDVTLTVGRGEFVSFLGASGSGKTTTLMMIAGFTAPTRGDLLVDGRSIVNDPPDKRNLGVVFQSFALFPHMNVEANVAFPLRMRRLPKAETARMVGEALEMVKLAGYGSRRISELSGGQQQRVALARALVYRPPVLLMDEPLGALDRNLRIHMQSEIKRIQRSLGITVIYVTHDQEEALVMSDRIVIMDGGRVHQIGTPEEVYEKPATEYVAGFLGESNFLLGTVASTDGGTARVALSGGTKIDVPGATFRAGDKVKVMFRPESASLNPTSAGRMNSLPVTIVEEEYLGQSVRYYGSCGTDLIAIRLPVGPSSKRLAIGAKVDIHWPADSSIAYQSNQ